MPLLAILDDEETLCRYLSSEFMALGYEVVSHTLKSEFLEFMPVLTPDVIVTDIYAPRMTGIEFMERLRQDPRFSGIPVIVMSGNLRDNPAMHKAVRRLGAFDAIPKPCEIEHLAGRVKAALERKG